jgi:hypothetical protein
MFKAVEMGDFFETESGEERLRCREPSWLGPIAGAWKPCHQDVAVNWSDILTTEKTPYAAKVTAWLIVRRVVTFIKVTGVT